MYSPFVFNTQHYLFNTKARDCKSNGSFVIANSIYSTYNTIQLNSIIFVWQTV